MTHLVPPPIRRGDLVAAVSLSSGLAAALPHRYAQGKRQFEATFGVRIVEAPHALADDAWLRRHPEARAADLHWALTHPEVRGIVSTIGGDDAVRVVPHLDRALLRTHPKPFLGFSDTTAVLLAYHAAGVVAYHGPALMTDLAETGGIRPAVRDAVAAALFTDAPYTLAPADAWTEERADWGDPVARGRRRDFGPSDGWTWLQGWEGGGAPSRVAGPLIGGCAEILEMCKATPDWPARAAWDGAVLLLETSELAPSPRWVGYWLRNYGAQGILQRLAALVLGRPCGYGAARHAELHATVRTVLGEWGRGDLPVLAGVDVGHTSPQLTVPIGATVALDRARAVIDVLRAPTPDVRTP